MASKKNKGSDAPKGPYTATGYHPHNFEPMQHRTDWGSSKNTPGDGTRVIRGAIATHSPRTWK